MCNRWPARSRMGWTATVSWWVSACLHAFFEWVLAVVFGTVVLTRLMFAFMRGAVRDPRVRDAPPPCLEHPDLGRHKFLKLQVSSKSFVLPFFILMFFFGLFWPFFSVYIRFIFMWFVFTNYTSPFVVVCLYLCFPFLCVIWNLTGCLLIEFHNLSCLF